jgi:thiamine-phosphate pyrophosphorylase
MRTATCRLYLITPSRIEDPAAFARTLELALAAGDVAALQVRLKDQPDSVVETVTEAVRPLAQARGVAVIMNDRPDLAARLGCDGVHVGQEDASYAEARGAVGPGGIVGVTCHDSRGLAMEAAEAGADYVAFGAMFPSSTKDPKAQAELELLTTWQADMYAPCVAIGGITVENVRQVVAAGADFVAVSAGVWSHPEGPAAAVAALNAEIAEGLAERSRAPEQALSGRR